MKSVGWLFVCLFVCLFVFGCCPRAFECRRRTLADANMKDLTTVDVRSVNWEGSVTPRCTTYRRKSEADIVLADWEAGGLN